MDIDKSLGNLKTINCETGKKQKQSFTDGSQIGEYRIIRMLGCGGMGEVYEAEHTSLGKHYALKILPANFAAMPGAVERFRREARVMANLEHPNIIKVDDFGETHSLGSASSAQASSGQALVRYWLRMELVKGISGVRESGSAGVGKKEIVTLAEFAERCGGKIEQAVFIPIIWQILEAMSYAHSMGVVHRDLKPSNILLESKADDSGQRTDDGKSSNQGAVVSNQTTEDPASSGTTLYQADDLLVKISDFGLVLLVGEDWVRSQVDNSIRRSMTMGDLRTIDADGKGASTKSLIGTYEYMSPEQKRGDDAGKPSDVYAIGLMCFRLLTGHTDVGMEKPSEIDSTISVDWDNFIGKALKQNPESRFTSASDMLLAFRKINDSVAKAQIQNTEAGIATQESEKNQRSDKTANGRKTIESASINRAYIIPNNSGLCQTEKSLDELKYKLMSDSEQERSGNTFKIASTITVLLLLSLFGFWFWNKQNLKIANPYKTFEEKTSLLDKELIDKETAELAAKDVAGKRTEEELKRRQAEDARNAKKSILTQKIRQNVEAASYDIAVSGLEEYAAEFGKDEYYNNIIPMVQKAKNDAEKVKQNEDKLNNRKNNVNTAIENTKTAEVNTALDINSARDATSIYLEAIKNAKNKYICSLQSFLESERKNGDSKVIEELKQEISNMNNPKTNYTYAELKNTVARRAQYSFRQDAETLKTNYVADLEKALSEEEKYGKSKNVKLLRDYIDSLGLPSATDGKFNNLRWFSSSTVPAGEYKLGFNTIVIVREHDKAKSPEVNVSKSTIMRSGTIFVQSGALKGQGATFDEISLNVELGGNVEFKDGAFINCQFGKGGSWFVARHSARFVFANCRFTGKFFRGWDVVNIGVKAENCTFENITFPKYNYSGKVFGITYEDISKELKGKGFYFQKCVFRNCNIPESVLAACSNCIFEGCKFIKEDKLVSSGDIDVSNYLKKHGLTEYIPVDTAKGKVKFIFPNVILNKDVGKNF